MAADLVGRLDKPTVNDPLMIRRTTRDVVTDLLQGIPDCRIPRVWRQRAGADFSIATLQAALPLPFSILARPVGTHGGDDFLKFYYLLWGAAVLCPPHDTTPYFVRLRADRP